MANTGVDPHGSFLEFVKKDVIKNIDVHKDKRNRVDDFEKRKDYPAIGTMKKLKDEKRAYAFLTSINCL